MAATKQSSEVLAYFAAFLFNHNAGIGILSFALGMLAGVPVVHLHVHERRHAGSLRGRAPTTRAFHWICGAGSYRTV